MAEQQPTPNPSTTTRRARGEQCERIPRAALIAHLRERIAAGELGNDAQLRCVARSPRLLEELSDHDVDGGAW